MRTRWLSGAAVLLAAAGLLAGCGSDDDSEAAGGDFCQGFIELNAGDPTPEQIRDVAADAPDDARTAMESIADGFEEKGEEYFDSPDFGKNFEKVNGIAADECADDEVDVTASEYKYGGVPDSFDAGIVAVTLKNAGGEFHEITVARRNDDTDKSFDEILALGEDEAEKLVEMKGGTFSEPGGEVQGIFDLSEPGDYVALCFIPVGSTPDNEEADGPPHFTKGMKVEFTVE